MAPLNKKGLTLPGYNYLGPFNDLDNGEPTNKADQAARKHDFAYDQLIKEGVNPYLSFNKADQDLIDELQSDSSFGGNLARAFFHVKKQFAPELGGTGKGKAPASSAAKEKALKRKFYFARSNKGAKQQKMSNAETAEVDEGAGEGPSDIAQPSTYNTGGGGSGGGGGGSHGVGVSTGGWSGGCYFSDNAVITTVTRQWYAPIYNGHLYQQIKSTNANKQWQGISTPWGYFNFNYYASHFSPQDWQRLLNEYKRWRPKAMKVKIYNLQIKQVVTLGADTLYNNDLTAGVHIFCDGSHQFPYAQHPWDQGNLPELPNDIYKLPQYAYYQQPLGLVQDNIIPGENVPDTLRQCAPLFMLENATHEVLRTGEQTAFDFSFDCAWVHNDRSYCPPQASFNPLVASRRSFPVWNNTTNRWTATTYHPYNKPSNWVPGPGTTNIGKRNTAQNDNSALGPYVTIYQPPGTKTTNGADPTGGATDIDEPSIADVQNQGYTSAPMNQAASGVDYPTLHNVNQGAGITAVPSRNFDIDMTRWGSVWSVDGVAGDYNTDTSRIQTMWMFPNQVWNDTPISRSNPIWDKVPRTDKHTLLASADGTIPMHHPPGTIFVKVAKIPIPTENNTDSYLNLYVTGQVTCQIVWEVERYQTKNWRPEGRVSSYAMHQDVYNVTETGAYNYSTASPDNMSSKMGINRVG